MQLLFKNVSLTKKVEFTLSSKIIQAACLLLFSGSVIPCLHGVGDPGLVG